MHSSVSSTIVTVWAFNPNCFLMNVPIRTSIIFLSRCEQTALKGLDESEIHKTA
jgi:hypothetical protein